MTRQDWTERWRKAHRILELDLWLALGAMVLCYDGFLPRLLMRPLFLFGMVVAALALCVVMVRIHLHYNP